ncbi:MAG TPA: tryptophan synthase subunit alpha [Gemmataceae bacterium]|nr:tryptophan synthase subunit alpha [Gemmataceae bacterium]
MNPIDALFHSLRSQGRKAFMPFITAGDPDLQTTVLLCRMLARHGANLIEIGFPYSDPIADGPVIQASYSRALTKGVRVDDIFETIGRLSADPIADRQVPLVSMVSYALVHCRGPEKFIDQAKKAGFSGVIVPDLPLEEAEKLAGITRAQDFKLIQLVAPTTPPDRAKRIANTSTGFLYYVSVAGITGARDKLPDELLDQVRWLRGLTDLPICVGFGISKPEHARMLREVADGIIVGSAFVQQLADLGSRPVERAVDEVGRLAESLAQALNPDR